MDEKAAAAVSWTFARSLWLEERFVLSSSLYQFLSRSFPKILTQQFRASSCVESEKEAMETKSTVALQGFMLSFCQARERLVFCWLRLDRDTSWKNKTTKRFYGSSSLNREQINVTV